MNIRCLWDNVLLLVDRGGVEKKSAGGIVMPATAKQGHRRQGEIVGIGPGKPMFYDGQWITRPMTVKIGQHITFEIGAGTVYPQDDGKEYIVLVEEQITGIYPTAEEIRAEQEAKDRAFAENHRRGAMVFGPPNAPCNCGMFAPHTIGEHQKGIAS